MNYIVTDKHAFFIEGIILYQLSGEEAYCTVIEVEKLSVPIDLDVMNNWKKAGWIIPEIQLSFDDVLEFTAITQQATSEMQLITHFQLLIRFMQEKYKKNLLVNETRDNEPAGITLKSSLSERRKANALKYQEIQSNKEDLHGES